MVFIESYFASVSGRYDVGGRTFKLFRSQGSIGINNVVHTIF